MLAKTIGLLGAGRMATALARGWVMAGTVEANSILASDPSADARAAFAREVPGATVDDDNHLVATRADVIVLAVKPQQMTAVLDEVHRSLQPHSLVVSIAAGVPLERLAAGLPPGQRIVRVMPNTPCLIGRGASCFSRGHGATANDALLVEILFSAVGSAYEVDESLLDAVTGLSGSGPAFVYTMVEALTEGGVAAGLPAELAAELAIRTACGAAEMVLETGEPPAVLRDRVTSPGGTTQAGLAVLTEREFSRAVIDAVVAATRRSAELGRGIK